jgi:hypothetical protein
MTITLFVFIEHLLIMLRYTKRGYLITNRLKTEPLPAGKRWIKLKRKCRCPTPSEGKGCQRRDTGIFQEQHHEDAV